MNDRKRSPSGDYEVGYGKPPKHTQFMPGQSGNKGRRKKRPETQAEIVARVRDEMIILNGQKISKFELAVTSTLNQTIKSGKPRDLKALLDLLDRHGAVPQADHMAQMAAEADAVIKKLFQTFDRTYDIDPVARDAIAKLGAEELNLIMGCPHCSEELRRRWSAPDYKELVKRYEPTRLHGLIRDGQMKVKGTQ